MKNGSHEKLMTLWGIQDGLLQSYRSIFITSESIILAISVSVLATNFPLVSILLLLPGMFIIYLWNNVCKNRALDVSFVQWLLTERIEQKNENIENVVCVFKEWQKTKKYKDMFVLEDPSFKDLSKCDPGSTREKMEKHLPLSFMITWAIIVLIAIGRFCISCK